MHTGNFVITSYRRNPLILQKPSFENCSLQINSETHYFRIQLEGNNFLQGCADDGETHAGSRMLHLLQVFIHLCNNEIHISDFREFVEKLTLLTICDGIHDGIIRIFKCIGRTVFLKKNIFPLVSVFTETERVPL